MNPLDLATVILIGGATALTIVLIWGGRYAARNTDAGKRS